MTPHELAILDEQALSDWRIVGEVGVCEAALCDMRVTTVLHRDGGGFEDDHCTTYLRCHCHGHFFVVTDFVNGRCDIRPMTAAEIERYAKVPA